MQFGRCRKGEIPMEQFRKLPFDKLCKNISFFVITDNNMTKKDINEVMCKSFFKSGEKTNKREFTRAWVELINRLEKSKCLTA